MSNRLSHVILYLRTYYAYYLFVVAISCQNDCIWHFAVLILLYSVYLQLNSFFDGKCTPDNVANIVYAILRGQLQSLFHKINIHGALTSDQVKDLLQPAIEQAKSLQNINSSSSDCTDSVYITVSSTIIK